MARWAIVTLVVTTLLNTQTTQALTASAQTAPTQAGLAQAGLAQAGLAQAAPTQAAPTQAGPAQAAPAQGGPAQAGTKRTAPKTVFARYVTDGSPRGTHPDEPVTGRWRLGLRDGRVVRLDDAMSGPGTWPALTPHGSKVAYYRKADGAWVVRDLTTGRVRAVPGRSHGKGPFCLLSPGGRFLVVCGKPYRIVDARTGRAHALPGGRGQLSFSPDNAYLLFHRWTDPTGRSLDPGSTEVYSTRTWTVVRRGTVVGALAMGGKVIATLDKHQVRFHDVATGRSVRDPIGLPLDETPRGLVWDRAGHLDVRTDVERRYRHGLVIRPFAHRWRRAGKGMRILDTFQVTDPYKTNLAPGGLS